MSISGKSTTVSNGSQEASNGHTNSELSKEEKLKKRREQLELWRQKKQQQQQQQQQQKEEPQQEDDVKKLRQQRIEEWKKSRLQKQSQVKSKTTSITIKKKQTIGNSSSEAKKRSLAFDEDDDDATSVKKPLFKKPDLKNLTIRKKSKGGDSEDELDLFLATLEKENKKSVPAVTDEAIDVEEDDDDEKEEEDLDDEIEEDARLQNLISSKLTKLQNKGKELQAIDHSLEKYEPVRKSFYQEPFELLSLLSEEVATMRQELDNIKVHGIDIPRPVLKWGHLSLPTSISSVIHDKLKFAKPSSIQSQALPTILAGRDVIAIAKTGSGKTLSFVLPMIRHIQDQRSLEENEGPIALILSPTRELALQIQKEILNFTKDSSSLRVCCCYGGASIESQINELKKGVEIVVATPGRMIDLLAANSGRVTNLKRTTYVVLDEADRMFDLGFEPQVNKIFTQIRPDRQTVLFSATFPKKMEVLAKKILANPVVIIVGGISVVAAEIKQEVVLFKASTDETYKSERIATLHEVLSDYQTFNPESKILVFVEKQSDADELVANLLMSGFPSVALHGGKDQMDRKYAIKEFSSNESGVNILIATSIAARGLDVKSLGLVINFDPPNHMEDYVHRVGRTGRAGAKGQAITFVCSNQEREISNLVKALRLSKADVPADLAAIADKFLGKVKLGKEKFNSGFGGKGLDNLQEIRDSKLQLEKQRFGESTDEKPSESKKLLSATPASNISLPEFEVVEGNTPDASGPDTCKFHCRIVINDLPQEARRRIVHGPTIAKIIEESHTSITTRGQYYPPGSRAPVENNKSTSKLYLLVEGLTRQAVADATTLIRTRIVESLERLDHKESTQQTGGRYVV
ncbi:Pre-mRNA-processing ATP-dependent RNA helicase PRP5 [Candida viswanathii]|uniref:RNA helicase n=1 Tax=Candida viswanathii TaxID=5486 RepID=A0A367XUS5_9ASCO|nr:Pre-mRNA-processing ATP-dependent RNA helicase PRP5 [Candida viswanathii]